MKNALIILFCTLSISVWSQGYKVLFIGNSYTFYNDLPTLVKNAAASTNDVIVTDQNTISGYTWQQHAADATTISKIKAGGFDYVVLQGNSLELAADINTVNTNSVVPVTFLDSLVHKYNPCAQSIFYNTWGRKNGSNGLTYIQQDSLIAARYMMIADKLKGNISPVGEVRRYIRANYPAMELYISDESHPTPLGSYVSAICFYTVITRKDPTLVTYNFSLSDADANAIKQAVKLILFNDMTHWHVGLYDPKAPIASFDIASNVLKTISLTNSSQNATNYLWNFGDNLTSTALAPSHTYAIDGTYDIKLTASYCSFTNTITKSINTFSNVPVIVNIQQNPIFVGLSDKVTISATITDDKAVTGATLYWGTTAGNLVNSIVMTNAISLYSAQIPAQAGGITIYYRIDALDADANKTSSIINNYLVHNNHAPVVNAGSNQSITLPTSSVTLAGSATDVDGDPLSYSWTIVSGGTAIIAANTSATTTVTGLGNGTYVFRLTVSDGKTTSSSDVSVIVKDISLPNIALNKPATASTATQTATNANDGNTGTRWESATADPQWIMIDLLDNYFIYGAKIIWETAASKSYTVEVSQDGINWTSIYNTTTGTSGASTKMYCNSYGRYVRMTSTARTTVYGNSIYEFEVYGSLSSVTSVAPIIDSETEISLYPNPANDIITIKGISENSLINIYNAQGLNVIQTIGNKADVSSLSSGIYVVMINNKSLKLVK